MTRESILVLTAIAVGLFFWQFTEKKGTTLHIARAVVVGALLIFLASVNTNSFINNADGNFVLSEAILLHVGFGLVFIVGLFLTFYYGYMAKKYWPSIYYAKHKFWARFSGVILFFAVVLGFLATLFR